MKIDTKEIEKINESLDSIEGWKVKDFKIWETSDGTNMATIRLIKSKEEKKNAKPNGGMAMGVDIVDGCV
jgi:Co/Zn/Cd efflux system component